MNCSVPAEYQPCWLLWHTLSGVLLSLGVLERALILSVDSLDHRVQSLQLSLFQTSINSLHTLIEAHFKLKTYRTREYHKYCKKMHMHNSCNVFHLPVFKLYASYGTIITFREKYIFLKIYIYKKVSFHEWQVI